MAGAMVIESPVWIPIGSRFSMVVMMITLSFLSRKSSSSNSFQPISALSMSTSWMGEASRPRWSRSSNFSLSYTSEAPVPPRVNEGRMHSGKPNSWAISLPLRYERAILHGAVPTPILAINWRNCSRSSVMLIASMSTPMSSTPYFSHTPFSWASMARLSAVWPPMVGSTASIFCSERIFSMDLTVRGSRYTWSAVTGSVMMVAGLELIRVTSIPSSRNERAAWLPE